MKSAGSQSRAQRWWTKISGKTETDRQLVTVVHGADGQMANAGRESSSDRVTFLTPFIACSLLAAPSLAMLVLMKLAKQTNNYLLTDTIRYMQFLVWVLVPLAVLCGLAFIVRSRNLVGRGIAVAVVATMVIGLVYAMQSPGV